MRNLLDKKHVVLTKFPACSETGSTDYRATVTFTANVSVTQELMEDHKDYDLLLEEIKSRLYEQLDHEVYHKSYDQNRKVIDMVNKLERFMIESNMIGACRYHEHHIAMNELLDSIQEIKKDFS